MLIRMEKGLSLYHTNTKQHCNRLRKALLNRLCQGSRKLTRLKALELNSTYEKNRNKFKFLLHTKVAKLSMPSSFSKYGGLLIFLNETVGLDRNQMTETIA